MYVQLIMKFTIALGYIYLNYMTPRTAGWTYCGNKRKNNELDFLE